jgi:hypothetical protein
VSLTQGVFHYLVHATRVIAFGVTDTITGDAVNGDVVGNMGGGVPQSPLESNSELAPGYSPQLQNRVQCHL